MKNKVRLILEIAVVLIACIVYTIKVTIPEIKASLGSSDKFINTSSYKNILEFNIDNKINFAVVINDNKEIYHLIFFDKSSIILYNQNIEGNSIDTSLESIIKTLIENNYLTSASIIKVTRYENTYYDTFKESLLNVLTKYQLNTNIIEAENTLSTRCSELNISGTTSEELLKELDLYSKELVSNDKNNINKKSTTDETLSDTTAKTLTNNVYKKIEEYKDNNNIETLAKDNAELVINLIPADTSGKYYPTSNSWYYIKESKVYAYIELTDNNNTYSYCYNGSIDLIKKGEC
jgi:hypothetical protein